LKTTQPIPTKLCTTIKTPRILRVWSKQHTHNKSKVADDRHFENWKIAIYRRPFDRLSRNFTRWRTKSFWTTSAVKTSIF